MHEIFLVDADAIRKFDVQNCGLVGVCVDVGVSIAILAGSDRWESASAFGGGTEGGSCLDGGNWGCSGSRFGNNLLNRLYRGGNRLLWGNLLCNWLDWLGLLDRLCYGLGLLHDLGLHI